MAKKPKRVDLSDESRAAFMAMSQKITEFVTTTRMALGVPSTWKFDGTGFSEPETNTDAKTS